MEYVPKHHDYPLNLTKAVENAIQAFIIDGLGPAFKNRSCVYTKIPKENSAGCAIGLSLPHRCTIRRFLGGVHSLVRYHTKMFNRYFNCNLTELSRLQYCHDTHAQKFNFRQAFARELLYALTSKKINAKISPSMMSALQSAAANG
jgi:hypothetical protein